MSPKTYLFLGLVALFAAGIAANWGHLPTVGDLRVVQTSAAQALAHAQ